MMYKEYVMPMTKRELKKAMRQIDRQDKDFMRKTDTKQWLGVADAHIAHPMPSWWCAIRYYFGKLVRK